MKRTLRIIFCMILIGAFVLTSVGFSVVQVKKISLNNTDITLYVKDICTLKASISPANASNLNVTFSSSNKSVASIDGNGKIKANKVGKAVITVTSVSNKKVTANCKVTVAKAGEKIVIKMEHQDTEKPERIQFYEQVKEKYSKMHPNVKIEITKGTFTTASTLVLTAITSGDPFDIFAAGVGDAKTWLSKDAIMNLTDYLYANNGEWINTFRDGVVDMITYGDGKIYSIPYFVDTAPLCYHKEIFAKYNVQPAKTKEEFYALCEKFKSLGYIPFQLHGSMGDDILNTLALQFAAKYGVKPFDIASGKVPFTDPWHKDALALFKEMYDKGYLPKSFWTIGGTDGRMAYSQGKMPMKFGYFWDVDTHKDMGMPYENQGVASLPNFTGTDGIKLYKPVSVGSFMVSNKSKNPDIVIDFLKFLTNDQNQYDMAFKYFGRNVNGMPVVNKTVRLSEYALKYMDDLAKGSGTTFSPANVTLTATYLETFGSKIPLFMEGKITLDEVAAEFEKLRSK